MLLVEIMKKKKKIGYVNINEKLLQNISESFPNIIFYNIRKSKHKIYDIVLHNDLIDAEEKALYEIFNTYLVNVDNSSYKNIIDQINTGLRRDRCLSSDQIMYINVVNKFQYINEKIEKLVGDEKSHSLKVAYLAKVFCDKTGMSEERKLQLYMAGLMHDIGKMYIDPKILCKKGKLTEEEYDEVKIHPIKSYEILKGYLPEGVLLLIRDHHKRENNSGYPMNEEASSEWGKILGLFDSYDAMISKRIYNKPLTKSDGINELLLCTKEVSDGGKGVLFNPYLTELFIKTL